MTVPIYQAEREENQKADTGERKTDEDPARRRLPAVQDEDGGADQQSHPNTVFGGEIGGMKETDQA